MFSFDLPYLPSHILTYFDSVVELLVPFCPASSSSKVQETALALQEAPVRPPDVLEAVVPVSADESHISPGI